MLGSTYGDVQPGNSEVILYFSVRSCIFGYLGSDQMMNSKPHPDVSWLAPGSGTKLAR
jgi:hypothetical protein